MILDNFLIRDWVLELIIPIVTGVISIYLLYKYNHLKKQGALFKRLKTLAIGFLLICIGFLFKSFLVFKLVTSGVLNFAIINKFFFGLSTLPNFKAILPFFLVLSGIFCLFSVSFKERNTLSLITLMGIIIISTGFFIDMSLMEFYVISSTLLFIIGINEIIKDRNDESNSLVFGIFYISLGISFLSYLFIPESFDFYIIAKIARFFSAFLLGVLFTYLLLKRKK